MRTWKVRGVSLYLQQHATLCSALCTTERRHVLLGLSQTRSSSSTTYSFARLICLKWCCNIVSKECIKRAQPTGDIACTTDGSCVPFLGEAGGAWAILRRKYSYLFWTILWTDGDGNGIYLSKYSAVGMARRSSTPKRFCHRIT